MAPVGAGEQDGRAARLVRPDADEGVVTVVPALLNAAPQTRAVVAASDVELFGAQQDDGGAGAGGGAGRQWPAGAARMRDGARAGSSRGRRRCRSG